MTTVLAKLTGVKLLDQTDLGAWKAESAEIEKGVLELFSNLTLEEAFGSDVITLDELRALYMKKMKEAAPKDRMEYHKMAAVMGGLSAMGNSQDALRLLSRKDEFESMMTTLGVLARGRYDRSNPYSFPLSFFGRLFPEARHRVGAAVVSKRFAPLILGYLEGTILLFAQTHFEQYLYPGGASAIPVIEDREAVKLYVALMTAVSIVISRRRDGSGTWQSVSMEQTLRFMKIVAQDGFGFKKEAIRLPCPEFDPEAFLKRFCGPGSLYTDHPLYGFSALSKGK